MGDHELAALVTLVGYGVESCGGTPGVRRAGPTLITMIVSDDLNVIADMFTEGRGVGVEVCGGDSGGALFLGETLAGVIRGGNCRSISFHERVDLHLDLIESASSGSPAAGVSASTTSLGHHFPKGELAKCGADLMPSTYDEEDPAPVCEDGDEVTYECCTCDSWFTEEDEPTCCDVGCEDCDVDCEAGEPYCE
jgi:hypothetical protein